MHEHNTHLEKISLDKVSENHLWNCYTCMVLSTLASPITALNVTNKLIG